MIKQAFQDNPKVEFKLIDGLGYGGNWLVILLSAGFKNGRAGVGVYPQFVVFEQTDANVDFGLLDDGFKGVGGFICVPKGPAIITPEA